MHTLLWYHVPRMIPVQHRLVGAEQRKRDRRETRHEELGYNNEQAVNGLSDCVSQRNASRETKQATHALSPLVFSLPMSAGWADIIIMVGAVCTCPPSLSQPNAPQKQETKAETRRPCSIAPVHVPFRPSLDACWDRGRRISVLVSVVVLVMRVFRCR